MENKLAMLGGTPVKTTPFGKGSRYGEAEMAEVKDTFDHGSLIYWGGYKIGQFCETVKKYFGVEYCAGCSSGSAAIHAAIGAAKIEPGYEVITSPITDIGSLVGIIYQNLIPVFADVDPNTYNMTPESVEKVITDRTRAIVVVHLAGNPCDMDGIMAVAKKHDLFVIEDCAQAYGTLYKGRLAGTIGDVGAFSLNESKHLSAGDGGFIITNDKEIHGVCHNYMDKYYDRLGRGDRLDHIAPNYRASELQYAVGKAQFARLDDILAKRRKFANILSENLAGIDGITLPKVLDGCESSWWFYLFRLTPGVFEGDGPNFAKAMCAEGCWAQAGYIPQPIYREKVFAQKSFFPGNVWPAEVVSGRSYAYPKGLCPVAEEVLATSIRLPVSEFFTEDDALDMVKAVKKVAEGLRK
ncbi:MAG: DegT/DnrJ/EryC1/StrS family aminotransferase [Lentisphaerae bacterium]|nr:DegT/DnrJ/EryC1/StrS family aminotransferase [Lentisphaerota bacterium]